MKISKVKLHEVQLRQKYQRIRSNNYFFDFFFRNLLHFHTDWLTSEGLATKVDLHQIQTFFEMGLLGPKTNFLNPRRIIIREKSHD
jgi:hypothetical protein